MLPSVFARLMRHRCQWQVQLPNQARAVPVQLRAIGLEPLTLPILWLLLQWLALLIAAQAMLPHQLIKIVASLLTAWVAIRLTTTLVRDATWSRLIAMAAWTIAALNILNLLEPASQLLDSIALSFGNLRISALIIIKAALSLAVLLWLAAMAGRLLERRITTLPNLTPSLQVLLSKLFKMRPQTKDGAPVDGGKISIPIIFKLPKG